MLNFFRELSRKRKVLYDIKERMDKIQSDTKPLFKEDKKEAIIYLDLSESEIYDPESKSKKLNPACYERLENVYSLLKNKKRVKVEITFSVDTSEGEKEEIINLIKNHYSVVFHRYKFEIRKTYISSLLLLLVGMALLIANSLLSYFEVSYIFNEVVDICAWDFVWESCDLFAFTQMNTRATQLRALRLFDALPKK